MEDKKIEQTGAAGLVAGLRGFFHEIKKAWSREDRSTTYTLVFVLIFLLGLAVYAWMLNNQMFWDDNEFILHNSYIQDWSFLPKMFSENVIAGAGLGSNYYRPVLLVVFSLFWHIWQTDRVGYHLASVFIHCLDAGLIFGLFWRLFKRRGLAIAVSLIFLLHPLQTESVSYANSLGDSLSVLWILIGLLFYERAIEEKKSSFLRVSMAATFYALAILSKETAIILPGLAFLLEMFSQNLPEIKKDWRNILARLSPLFVTAIIYVILRATILNFGGTFNLYQGHNAFTDHLGVRILTFFRSYLTYVTLIFWPAVLHMERIVPFETNWSIMVGIGGGLLLATFALVILFFRKAKEISFGLSWFLVCLAPTSNVLVPINGLIYEHWLYLPMAGASMAISCAAYILLRKIFKRETANRIGLVCLGGTLMCLSARTILRNLDWRDAVTFYRQTLTYAPKSYRMWNNYGMALADAGQLKEAEAAYGRAIQIDDSATVAHHNMGNLYFATGRLLQAESEYKKAVALQPSFLFTYLKMAELYHAMGEEEKAESVLQEYNFQLAKIQGHR